MSVAEMQAFLARLYVDESFRKLFVHDAAAVLAGYSLTDEEAAAVKNIDLPMVEFFARSLVQKRKGKLLRAYSSLFSINSRHIDRLYLRFCQLYTPNPHHTYSQEIIDFGLFMEESLYDAENVPPHARDLTRYERFYYLAKFAIPAEEAPLAPADGAPIGLDATPARTGGVQVVQFRYNVARIDEILREGGTPTNDDLHEGEYFIVFQPAATPPGPKTFRVTLPTKVLLDACDGIRTVTEIIRLTELRLQASGLGDRVLEMLAQLLARHLIENTER